MSCRGSGNTTWMTLCASESSRLSEQTTTTIRRTHDTHRTLGPPLARNQGHLGHCWRHYDGPLAQAADREALREQDHRQRHCRAWPGQEAAGAGDRPPAARISRTAFALEWSCPTRESVV